MQGQVSRYQSWCTRVHLPSLSSPPTSVEPETCATDHVPCTVWNPAAWQIQSDEIILLTYSKILYVNHEFGFILLSHFSDLSKTWQADSWCWLWKLDSVETTTHSKVTGNYLAHLEPNSNQKSLTVARQPAVGGQYLTSRCHRGSPCDQWMYSWYSQQRPPCFNHQQNRPISGTCSLHTIVWATQESDDILNYIFF